MYSLTYDTKSICTEFEELFLSELKDKQRICARNKPFNNNFFFLNRLRGHQQQKNNLNIKSLKHHPCHKDRLVAVEPNEQLAQHP